MAENRWSGKSHKSQNNASVIASPKRQRCNQANASVMGWRYRQRLTHQEALQGLCFCGVAISVSLSNYARSKCVQIG